MTCKDNEVSHQLIGHFTVSYLYPFFQPWVDLPQHGFFYSDMQRNVNAADLNIVSFLVFQIPATLI